MSDLLPPPLDPSLPISPPSPIQPSTPIEPLPALPNASPVAPIPLSAVSDPNTATAAPTPLVFTSSTSTSLKPRNLGYGAVLAIGLAGLLIVLVGIFIIATKWRRKRKKLEKSVGQQKSSDKISIKTDAAHEKSNMSSTGNPDSSLCKSKVSFTYEEVLDMTQGFAKRNFLGKGQFGQVYKGWFLDGTIMAVKQLKACSKRKEKEFGAEVARLCRIQHHHLVSLIGSCTFQHFQFLVYEFIPNKNLDQHLHGSELLVLNWPKRIKIATGAACGLTYLHENSERKTIHGDIKTSNILLDDSFEAKVTDFGFAELRNDTDVHMPTHAFRGNGYKAPECVSSGKPSDKSDVFSFGVVLLELITGRKPYDHSRPLGEENLVEWARPLLLHTFASGQLEELVDPRLANNYVKNEMLRMMEAAAACIHNFPPDRPQMMQVMKALQMDDALQDLRNIVNVTDSQMYTSSQYLDVQQIRKTALGSDVCGSDCSDHSYTEEYDSSSTESGEIQSMEFQSCREHSFNRRSSNKNPLKSQAPRGQPQ